MFATLAMVSAVSGVVWTWLSIRKYACFECEWPSNTKESSQQKRILDTWEGYLAGLEYGDARLLTLRYVTLNDETTNLLIRLAQEVAEEKRPLTVELDSITVDNGHNLFRFLQNIPIHTLTFNIAKFGSDQLGILREEIQSLPDLCCIDFHWLRFQSSAASEPQDSLMLGKAIRALLNKEQPNNVFKIRFDRCYCSVGMLHEIEEGLKECVGKVESLAFTHCFPIQSDLLGEAILDMMNWLEKAPEASFLKQIELDGNHLDAGNVAALSLIIESHPNLEYLSLNENEELFNESIPVPDCFCRALQNHPKLRLLTLANCGIGAASALRVLNALKSCKTLQTLALENNLLNVADWVWCIPELTSLETIGVPESVENSSDWITFVKALQKSTSLVEYRDAYRLGTMEFVSLQVEPILQRNRLLANLGDLVKSGVDLPLSVWPHLLHTLGSASGEEGTPLYQFLRAKHADMQGVMIGAR